MSGLWLAGILLAAVLLFGLLWFGMPVSLRKLGEARLARACRARRAIVLSYDDGPGAVLTPRLLDLLAEHAVTASFHVLGRNARQHPEILRRMIALGHDVGSHSEDHLNAWRSPPWRVARDVAAGVRRVRDLGGNWQLYRPPFGKETGGGVLQAALLGLRQCWWTVDSRDSWARRPIDEVLDALRRQGGGVVLMHDFDRYDRAPPVPAHADHVLDLTRKIIAFARAEGFQLLPLSRLLAAPAEAAKLSPIAPAPQTGQTPPR
jgi:peptidoglycan/xylan/chitin deacetylase (PgdA/CDA1 family)